VKVNALAPGLRGDGRTGGFFSWDGSVVPW
jgi:hypothetical protein